MHRITRSRAPLFAVALLAAGCGPLRGDRAAGGDAPGSVGQSFVVAVSRPEGGTIESLGASGLPDGKIRCGTRSPSNTTANACGPVSYGWSEKVSFAATPDDRYKFVAWAADCWGSGPCTLDTSKTGADKWLAAAFAPTATYRNKYFLVTIEKPSGGTVASLDGRIYCGSGAPDANRCGPTLYDWSAATVLATMPDAGHAFFGWGGDCSGKGECTLSTRTVESDKTVRATFGTGVTVRLEVTGLSDVGLAVANLDGSVRGIAANGTYSLGDAANGTAYSIIVTSHPPTQVCSTDVSGGVVDGSDVLVHMTCACKDLLANCDGNVATGCESNLGYDVDDCGACNHRCSVANGTAACNAGVCEVASCASGYTPWAGSCIAVTRACTVDNGQGTQTWNGADYGTCNVTACADGYSLSNNTCVPTVIACTVENGSGTSTYGTNGYGPCLIVACDARYDSCDGDHANGCETDLLNDVNNCGACRAACQPVTNGQVACVAKACVIASCDDGYVSNGASCVPVTVACDVANGTGTMTWTDTGYGPCVVTSCKPGYGVLDGACVPTEKACTLANASGTQTLLDGVYGPCVLNACNTGFGDCDRLPANGCETGLQADLANCGACNHACPAVANGQPACTNGTCGVAGCNEGYTLSGGQCVETTVSCFVLNGTGTQTWNGTTYGPCLVTSCNATYHQSGNVCESNLRPCSVPNATATQTWNGSSYDACVISSCDAGFANCNGSTADGCEVSLAGDVNNCGTCGHVCSPVEGGAASCNAGACGVATCGSGYVLFNGSCVPLTESCTVANGTGTRTWNGSGYGECVVTSCDPGYHASGTTCASDVIGCNVENGVGSQTWNGSAYGACIVTACAANYGNCDGLSSTGCESALQTDVGNCGACNHACAAVANGTAACNAGVCGLGACNAGYSVSGTSCVPTTISCTVANGTGTRTWDGSAYGACTVSGCIQGYHVANNSCAADVIPCSVPNATGSTATWNGTGYAACVIGTCNAGFADCDGDAANGCESSSSTDVDNCGACGNVCADVANGTRACTASVCGASACDPGFTLYGGQCMLTTRSCPVAHGTGTQTWNGSDYGTCTVLTCDGGYHPWNNACEADVITCTVPNGSGTQTWGAGSYGACVINACAATYADCDKAIPNGCEALLPSDPTNCGVCGNVCPVPTNGTAGCTSSACTISCNAGYHVESGACVSNTRTCQDPVLHQDGTQTWSNGTWGTCQLTTCTFGWVECDNRRAGCETDASRKQDCGACGNNCGGKACILSGGAYSCAP